MQKGSLAYQTILGAVLITALLSLYAFSPLRNHIENHLRDIRSTLAPTKTNVKDIVLIGIDEVDISVIESSLGHQNNHDLSFLGLQSIIKLLQKSSARHIAILLHAQVFSYQDTKSLVSLAEIAKSDPRIIIGINPIVTSEENSAIIPRPLRIIPDQIAYIEAKRTYRRDIVRDIFFDPLEKTPLLTKKIIEKLRGPEYLSNLPMRNSKRLLRLNYFAPQQIPIISARSIFNEKSLPELSGRTILLGYTAFRPWSDTLLDATHLHAPWESEADDVSQSSLSLLAFHAEAIINLLEKIDLKDASTFIIAFQLILLASLAFVFWFSTIGFACFLFIATWIVVFTIHAYLFSEGFYLPLADAFVASVCAMGLGGAFRLRLEQKQRALDTTQAKSRKDIADLQQKFLDRFADNLTMINQEIQHHTHFTPNHFQGEKIEPFIDRFQKSTQEFDEYLLGLSQLKEVNSKKVLNPDRKKLDIRKIVNDLCQKFDMHEMEKAADSSRFNISIKTNRQALGDFYLVQQILYNLISNALKYSPKDSIVTIEIRESSFRLLISISDQGPGIDKAYQDKIFEKFYRIKDQSIYHVKGHGLGLYLSRFFAEKIDAKIHLKSEIGKGSTFVFDMPAT